MIMQMMIANRKAPYGTGYGMEALDALLAASAFEQELCVAFFDDGVYQLKRDQNPAVLGFKHYTKTFAAFDDFGIDCVLVERESLIDRGLDRADLIEVLLEDGGDAVSIIPAHELAQIMAAQDLILQF